MSSITNIYKTKFKERLNPYGFSLYRKTFYRVVNDIVQMIMLSNWDSDYTVEYDVYPLCLEIQDLYVAGPAIHEYREGNFQNNFKRWGTWPCPFTREKPSNEVLEEYVEEMLSIVQSHLMPFFEKVVDWESWYEYISKKNAGNHGVWVYIKLGDYETASHAFKKWIEQNHATIQSYHSDPDDLYGLKKSVQMKIIKEKDLDWALEKHVATEKRVLEDIEKYTLLIELLSIPDTKYFEKVFTENEAKSRKYLSNPRKYKSQYGY